MGKKYPDEVWKEIPGSYSKKDRCSARASNYGRIKRGRTHLKQYPNSNGYLLCSVGGEWGRCLVHRVIASTWIPNPEEKEYVDHINGCKTDNRVENLRWATAQENKQYQTEQGVTAKRRQGLLLVVNTETGEGQVYKTIKDIATALGLDSRQISNVLAGRRKTIHGYSICRLLDINTCIITEEEDPDGLLAGLNFDTGTWAQYEKDDIILKITEKSEDGYTHRQLKRLVTKMIEPIIEGRSECRKK